MNEVLLVLLITFTCITFITLNKKIGAAGVIPGSLLPDRESIYYDNPLTKVIYSGAVSKTGYDNLWSVTASTAINEEHKSSPLNEMVLIYHQHGNVQKLMPYQKNTGLAEISSAHYDVCTVSSISDMQYRHVLVALDSVA